MSLNLTVPGRRVVTAAVAICCMAIAAGTADNQKNFITTAPTAEPASSAPCLTGLCPPGVWAVCEFNGDLYAGGQFTSANGESRPYVTRWDGTQWHDIGGGMNAYVYDLLVYDGNLIAGGVFDSVGGVPMDHIAAWDGVSWAPLGDLINDTRGNIRGAGRHALGNSLRIPSNYPAREGA